MKTYKGLIGGVVFLCLVFSGILLAEEVKKKEEGGHFGGKGLEREIKTEYPDCQGLVDQIKAKREEIKVLMQKGRLLRETAEKAKLEELKLKDPKKYEEMLAKNEEQKKKIKIQKEKIREMIKEGKTGEKREGRREKRERPEGIGPEQLEKLKTENPELYNIMMQLEAKRKEMKELHDLLKVCEEKNKSKK